uniref:Mrr-like domain-containing protein n=1 Tax=viral metagenome TaxID=1070528 RepID=A0A6C0HCV9_9ZZZZ
MSEQAKQIIRELIAKNIQTDNNSTSNKFDCLMQEIEKYIDGATAHNMVELKEKANNKKKKGDLFEAFCFLYLEIVLNHEQVWFYKDFPKELKDQFHLTKNDFGIDLLSKKGDHYYAVQCKYKKPQDKVQIISWRALSTFYAMVVKTGPWLKHITMTNVNGCKHIGQKTEKDWSICIGTFRKIDHFMWLKMSKEQDKISENTFVLENKITDKEIMRNKRLAYFSSNTIL